MRRRWCWCCDFGDDGDGSGGSGGCLGDKEGCGLEFQSSITLFSCCLWQQLLACVLISAQGDRQQQRRLQLARGWDGRGSLGSVWKFHEWNSGAAPLAVIFSLAFTRACGTLSGL
jgi:hypothetical protein